MVEQSTFREDLFYRLNVISVQLPPLRERKEDIPLLVDHFLKKFSQENNKTFGPVSPEIMRLLVQYDWPGNVRELENVVERAVVLSTTGDLSRELISLEVKPALTIPKTNGMSAMDGKPLAEILDSFERDVILQMLESVNWSQTEAAERFGLPLSTLNSKVKRLGIDAKRRRLRQ